MTVKSNPTRQKKSSKAKLATREPRMAEARKIFTSVHVSGSRHSGANTSLYTAMADASLAKRAGAARPFTIIVRFLGGLTKLQKDAFAVAADRWTTVIVGDLPPQEIDGEQVDDLLIEAEGIDIDGPNKILGQAGPSHLRPKSAGKAAFLPVKGSMSFDRSDLKAMQRDGTLVDVITHEMGHVLGIGTIWAEKGLLKGVGGPNPTFHGKHAMAEYGRLKGKNAGPTPVPVENSGGEGTRDSHWRETLFQNELMTGFVGENPNALSRLTVASLQDLGYVVAVRKAEKYSLPDLRAIAEAGGLVTHVAPIGRGVMLPTTPVVLPS
jgi:hypothetical protein